MATSRRRNSMTERLLDILRAKYELKELPTDDMGTLKANGMAFVIEAYQAKGLDHVSVMRAKGFFGLMKMDTLIVELYDTLVGSYSDAQLQAVKNEYTDLQERDPGEHWYDNIKLASSISKKGKKNQQARFDELALKHFEMYLSDTGQPVSDLSAKQEKASYYVNGLLEKGGPSTDVFKKALGEEQTAKLFGDILFGTH